MDSDQPVVADGSYSLEHAIMTGIEIEEEFGGLDLGPIDTLEPDELKREYVNFFGTSPLSSLSQLSSSPSLSLSPSPSPSTPPSKTLSIDVQERERQLDKSFGTSPLTPLPTSSSSSTPPTPTKPIFKPVTTKLNGKGQNRKKGCENRQRTPSPSPLPSTPPSKTLSIDVHERERQLDKSFGKSPLTPLPTSSSSSAPPTPAKPFSKPVTAKLNSKGRRNRKKGRENRKRKRQQAGAQNTVDPANVEKHVAAAETTQTPYDTKNIPSASTGFVALPDGGSGKYYKLRPLLRHHRLKLIRWRGR